MLVADEQEAKVAEEVKRKIFGGPVQADVDVGAGKHAVESSPCFLTFHVVLGRTKPLSSVFWTIILFPIAVGCDAPHWLDISNVAKLCEVLGKFSSADVDIVVVVRLRYKLDAVTIPLFSLFVW